jgi:hypothetical protein
MLDEDLKVLLEVIRQSAEAGIESFFEDLYDGFKGIEESKAIAEEGCKRVTLNSIFMGVIFFIKRIDMSSLIFKDPSEISPQDIINALKTNQIRGNAFDIYPNKED